MSDANSKIARLQFLWKASHLLLTQCPGASSHYMSQFLSLSNDHDLRLHEDIQTRSCAACGSIFVPGVNSKVRVVSVAETRAEREKRKRVERKKAKQDKKKHQQKVQEAGGGSDQAAASSEGNSTTTTIATSQLAGPGLDTTKNTTTTTKNSQQAQPRPKKIIRITPHTELTQQQQQQQTQQRINIRNGSTATSNTPKLDKHANQILNHIIYSCQRCDRITELPGTKEGFLNTRVKVTKPVSQRRKLKALQKQQQLKLQEPVAIGSTSTSAANTNPSTPTATTSGLQPLNTITSARSSPKLQSTPTVNNNNNNNNNTNTKRPASTHSSPSPAAGHQDLKRTKYSISLPASPTTGLSRATSAAPSAATSPAASPRPFGSNDKKFGLGGGGGNNKKKKKGGLMSMLANQKPKDSDAGAGGSASGSDGGDSVLANF
ncbi:MAG: hypothetical protein JOS17DRAFT_730914 [Linnemannia elongata]|nr:MAG: hypothetical protein JOS17DRAFT_730914 [Linnemannia elongata]